MNEFEENVYKEIKNELVQSAIDKKIDTYFTNKNELTHYFNVGKMIVNAQGGEERAKYGDGLIKRFSKRLTFELGKGYSYRTLNLMRKYYLFKKDEISVTKCHGYLYDKIVMHYDIGKQISMLITFKDASVELERN